MAVRKLPIVVVVFLGLGDLLSTAGADSRDSLVTARSKSLTDEDGRLLLAPGAGRLATGPAARRVESIDREPSRAASAAIPTADSGTDWNNFGGSPGRTGLTTVKGPDAAELLWDNTDDFSIISWHPVTLNGRVFAIRESGFPQQNGPANDKLVAYDLATGEELWSEIVSWAGDPDEEWIAYVGGVHGGKVYCARGGSGRTTPVHAYAVETGELLWSSVYETVAGPQDGMVFAPNGDVIVCDFGNAVRIDATDGSTVWATPRSCPVSGNCGCTASDTAAYIDEAAPGPSNVITKIDLATGLAARKGRCGEFANLFFGNGGVALHPVTGDVWGVEASFRFTVCITLLALAILVVFYVGALSQFADKAFSVRFRPTSE